jgi:hypothetical protein
MGIKAVFGYGINVDKLLLIGRHNDIEMGHPKKFFDEKLFPALEVRVSSVTPFVGEHYVLLLKSTIVENARDTVQFDDPKETAGYLEGLEQLAKWGELMGGHHTDPSMTIFLEPTSRY